jgi:tetratricopeptide (TPR) repeat protein
MLKHRFYKWLFLVFIWCFNPLNAQETQVDTILPYERLFRDAEKLIDSANYKQSIVVLKKAVKEKPDYWEAYNKMAWVKIKMKEYKEALKDLEKADKIAPFNYESLRLRGFANYHLANFAAAKASLDTAVYVSTEEHIEDYELFYYRALLMFKGKAYKQSLEALDIAVEFRPNYWEAILLKGEVRFAMKDYNYAIKELNEAIKLMPETGKDYNAYKLRAKSKFEVGDFKGAITDWNVYIEGIPKEEEALVSRAAAKINIDDNTGAIVDLDDAIKLNNKNPVSYCYRGVAKGGNKQYIEALKDLDYSIKLKFDYPAAYVNRAAIKMASKDKRGACMDLEKADGLGDEMAYKLIEKYCKDGRN